MSRKAGVVKLRIYLTRDLPENSPETQAMEGLKLTKGRFMTNDERRANIKRVSMPVHLEFEDGSMIEAFVTNMYIGEKAQDNRGQIIKVKPHPGSIQSE